MNKSKLLYTKDDIYKGQKCREFLYALDSYKDLPQIDVVRAVCFCDQKEVVFYKDINGYFGNPGGGIEEAETVEEALQRELIEEAQLKLLNWQTIAYEKIEYLTNGKISKTHYFLLTVAKVTLIDKEIKDPDGKGVGRVVVGFDSAEETLDWGEKGKILLGLASAKVNKLY